MKKFVLAASAAMAAAMIPGAAHAGNPDGKFQFKLMGTAVLPDGELTDVDPGGVLPDGSDTKADNNVVPTVVFEYFLTPNVSLETYCCVTKHNVTGAGALEGAEIVDDIYLIPATVTAKYHFTEGPFKPYIGAGPTYFLYLKDKAGSAAQGLGVDDVDIDDEFGFVLQAGVDFRLNDKGLGLSIDAKRYFIDATARYYADGEEVLKTEHNLDPWVVSAGLALRM
ncbi:OmpW/AlkL family protein [Croceicoccus naphthovorans]|uniref:Membrane protein n=1 Tax=Croceicoccus naphthovorans TaxID=1348774 RepID=A0A0G3XEE5_9SPHN|nr:OmpW family outer membrane protein [Croceicoccus naphthovorans]AKM09527.1 membrane protein [Croceicoccus naphthovorans]MBB3989725.1 outer membrane protein [Croceicoccus naphthovorans]